jgi:C4-dicarboxylate transporter, DctQ subunit
MSTFINKVEEGIISLLLASMTLLVFMEVVMRFGFNVGIHWAQELTLLLSGWMVMFGVSYGLKVGSHIGVDALVKLFSVKVRRAITIVAILLCLIYCGLFLLGSWTYLAKLKSIGIELEDIPVPKWIANSILFGGMILMALRLLDLLWSVIRGRADGFKLKDEAKESMYLAQKEGTSLDGDDE